MVRGYTCLLWQRQWAVSLQLWGESAQTLGCCWTMRTSKHTSIGQCSAHEDGNALNDSDCPLAGRAEADDAAATENDADEDIDIPEELEEVSTIAS